jgi:hypothetical protein
MKQNRKRLLRPIFRLAPKHLVEAKVHELVRVYHDLERTLSSLKRSRPGQKAAPNINLKKLIHQLGISKKRIERKIGNTLLLEKHHLKTKLRNFKSGFSKDSSR